MSTPTDGLGRPPERADFEAWANVAGFGERDAAGNFWFYRNGGDGMWDAYCAGAGDQRGRDAAAMRDYVGRVAVDACMAGANSMHAQTAEIVRAALELLESVQGVEAFPPEKMAAFRRAFGT